MLEVEPTAWSATEVTETGTKPSPAPFQKHSLGGCTIDMPPSDCRRQGHIVSRAILCFVLHFQSFQSTWIQLLMRLKLKVNGSSFLVASS